MTGTLKRPAPEASQPMRELLFGDLAAWPPDPSRVPGDAGASPWAEFVRAAEHSRAGQNDEAVALYLGIAGTPGIEPRHALQAWHFLRQHGRQPQAAVAKEVLGVVVDVHLEDGLDTLAAYPDHSARYLNHSGAAIIWETRDAEVDRAVDALLGAAGAIARRIGPWTEARPAPPPRGLVRLSILTPSGLHFGQAPFDHFARDPLAGPAVRAATSLLQILPAKAPPPGGARS